jgi:hypothetical protein
MVGFHRDLNRKTADGWASFAPHRQRVTAAITGAAGGDSGRVAVLGAGNGNDLALDQLVTRFAQVHLFDLDREALVRARDRQDPAVAARLSLHAPVDLGGALAEVGRFRARAATPDELGALPGAGVRALLERVPERFDVVASTCLLSQLVHGCGRVLGDEHPQLAEIACAVVVAHVRLVAQLLAPGGTGVIVTDTVSTDTYPLEELWAARAPQEILDEVEASGNHLSGTAPRFLRRIVNTDPLIAPLVRDSRLEEPWLWRLRDEESYLVYALAFRLRGGDR